jgi:hypothetical protein
MRKEWIEEKEEECEKNPLGAKIELDVVSLIRLALISDTKNLIVAVNSQ